MHDDDIAENAEYGSIFSTNFFSIRSIRVCVIIVSAADVITTKKNFVDWNKTENVESNFVVQLICYICHIYDC